MNIIKKNLITARIFFYLAHNDKAFYEENKRRYLIYPLHICKAKVPFCSAQQSAQMLSDILEKNISPENLLYVEENDPSVLWTPFNGWMYDNENGVFFTEKNGRHILFMDKRIWYNTKNTIITETEHWFYTAILWLVFLGLLTLLVITS